MSIATYNVSWDECMADMHRKPNECWGKGESVTGDKAFTGSESFEEAQQLAISGWAEGRDAMGADVEFAKAKQATFKRPDWEYSRAGQRVCIPSYVAGAPMHMMLLDDEDATPLPIVRIFCDIGATWNTSTEAMTRKGAAIVALIDQIERAGQRVELIATQISETHGQYEEQHIHITVKESFEPLDLDRVSFAVAHPSMLRRVCFRIMEFTFENRVKAYGMVEKMKNIPEDAMYIPPMLGDKGYEDMDAALATVNAAWTESVAYKAA